MDKIKFYEEQIVKIQEEFKEVSEKETRRKLDLLSMLEKLEHQMLRIKKEEPMNVKEKLYIDWAKQQGGYEITTFSNQDSIRFECVGLDEMYARLNTIFRLSDYDIYVGYHSFGLGIKDILNQKGLEVNKLNLKKVM